MKNRYCIMLGIGAVFLIIGLFLPTVVDAEICPPSHEKDWKGTDVGLTYGLANCDLDHFAPKNYAMTRLGNKLSVDTLYGEAQVDVQFNHLTQSPYIDDLFVWHDDKRFGIPVDAECEGPFYDGDNEEWVDGELDFVPGGRFGTYELYRYLHFKQGGNRDELIDEVTGNPIDDSMEKVIVLIHGWNRTSQEDAYLNEASKKTWIYLKNELVKKLEGTDWKLILYHWEEDADTGPGGPNAAVDGTQAAEISHQHGQHLGNLLNCYASDLEKVHFIEHSAGNWAGRSASRLLLAYNSQIRIQCTLLDPFMPNTIRTIDSVLGRDKWQWLEPPDLDPDDYNPATEANVQTLDDWIGSARIWKLENYYSDDGWSVAGTQERFAWRQNDKNRKVGIKESDEKLSHFGGHSGPIAFYAATVNNPESDPITGSQYHDWPKLQQEFYGRGWAESMFYEEQQNAIDFKMFGVNLTPLSAEKSIREHGIVKRLVYGVEKILREIVRPRTLFVFTAILFGSIISGSMVTEALVRLFRLITTGSVLIK